jgi:anti-anti-sigma factor
MEIVRREFQGVVSLSLRGRLDDASAPLAEAPLRRFLDSDKERLLIDLTELERISGDGFKVLLAAGEGVARKRGALVLCGLRADVKESLDTGGLTQLFTVAGTFDEGLRLLGARRGS